MATSAGKVLSSTRVALGASAWAAPNRTTRFFGLDTENNPQSSFWARLFGARDIVLGLTATHSTGPSKRLAWQLGILCDALDVVAAVLAGRSKTVPKRAALAAGATALSATCLGIVALQAEE